MTGRRTGEARWERYPPAAGLTVESAGSRAGARRSGGSESLEVRLPDAGCSDTPSGMAISPGIPAGDAAQCAGAPPAPAEPASRTPQPADPPPQDPVDLAPSGSCHVPHPARRGLCRSRHSSDSVLIQPGAALLFRSGGIRHRAPVGRAAAATRQTALACAGLAPFDQSVLTYPGGDSGGTPSAAQLGSWAATAAPRLQVLAVNVPVSLGPDAATVHAMLTTISNGRPVDPTPAQYAALTSFDQHLGRRSGEQRSIGLWAGESVAL